MARTALAAPGASIRASKTSVTAGSASMYRVADPI
jgi:hypothetical protein